MKVIHNCSKCYDEFGVPSFNLNFQEFNDSNCYEFICEKGHVSKAILQQQKFEILFEIGAHAILDGYYREAISSFTASLERFYEFAIKTMLNTSTDGIFNDVWKCVANQSERQLGGFIFLWASTYQEKPEILSDKYVSFRNAVIHKGKIPTKKEALWYGNEIKRLINNLKNKILNNNQQVTQVQLQEMSDKFSEEDNNSFDSASTISIKTIINLFVSYLDIEDLALEDHLLELNRRKKILVRVDE